VCHLSLAEERGLKSTVFNGRDRDSGEIIRLIVQDPTVKWDETLAEFLPLFSVTFWLHPMYTYDAATTSRAGGRMLSTLESEAEKEISRLLRKDSGRGDLLPLNSCDWRMPWYSGTFRSEASIELQWSN
jgi:hypothetical protein